MHIFRYCLLFVFTLININPALTCDEYFVLLKGYVDVPPGHATKDEILNMNLFNVRDSSGAPNHDLVPSYLMVSGKKLGATNNLFNEYISVHSKTDLNAILDTFLNKLNLQDTLKITVQLSKKTKNEMITYEDDYKGETITYEDYYEVYFSFMFKYQYILSSQAVVELKRNTSGNAFQVYPSPASNYVNVKFDVRQKKEGKISIYDGLGKELETVRHLNISEPYRFDLADQPAGNYFIHAVIDGENFVKKIVKD